MKDDAGGAALEAAPRVVIEFVGDDFSEQSQVQIDFRDWRKARAALKVADTFFHAAVVAGKVWWIIQGQHAEAGEHLIDVLVVEG